MTTFLIQIIGLLAYGSSSKCLKLIEWILDSGWSDECIYYIIFISLVLGKMLFVFVFV